MFVLLSINKSYYSVDKKIGLALPPCDKKDGIVLTDTKSMDELIMKGQISCAHANQEQVTINNFKGSTGEIEGISNRKSMNCNEIEKMKVETRNNHN